MFYAYVRRFNVTKNVNFLYKFLETKQCLNFIINDILHLRLEIYASDSFVNTLSSTLDSEHEIAGTKRLVAMP